MKFEAKLNFKEKPDTVYDCFVPEMEERDRSVVKLRKKKQGVEFDVKADDAVALRAAFNSLLKLMVVYEKMEKVNNYG